MAYGGNNFPLDILMKILLLLPAESLVKMTAVCKEWYVLIRDTEFMLRHFQQSTLRGNDMFMHGPRYFRRNDDSLKCHGGGNESIPVCFDTVCCQIVDSCNGLVCFTDAVDFGTIIHLFNPFIRKFRAIPTSPFFTSIILEKNQRVCINLGFGFHTPSNDHKVVRIIYVYSYEDPRDGDNEYSDDDDDVYESLNNVIIELYSLSSNSWKRIEDNHFPWILDDYFTRTYINNNVHWIGYKTRITVDPMIVSFDFVMEKFQEISPPHGYEANGIDEQKGNLLVIKNCLGFGSVCPNEDGRKFCSIWVMKEYGLKESWTKIIHIQVFDQIIDTTLSSIWENAIVLQDTSHGDLFFLEFNTNGSLKGTCRRVQQSRDSKEFVVVRNSLFLLEDDPRPENGTTRMQIMTVPHKMTTTRAANAANAAAYCTWIGFTTVLCLFMISSMFFFQWK